MPRVLLSNLAGINAFEATYFRSLMDAIQARGGDPVFWNASRRRDFGDAEVPMDWRIGNWPKHFPDYIFRGATPDAGIDYDKWLQRVSVLHKQDVPGYSAQDLLDIIIRVTAHILKKYDPAVWISWNTFCPHTGIGAEICERNGVPVLLMERAYLPNTYFVDTGGLVGASPLAGVDIDTLIPEQERERYRRIGRNYLFRRPFASMGRYNQQADPIMQDRLATGSLAIEGPRVVFFPPDDLSLGFIPFEGSDRKRHVPNFENSFAAAAALARANTAGITIFKPHPSFTPDYLEQGRKIAEGSPLLIIDHDYSTLIDWADVVATTGSGLAFVSMAEDKPVLHLGHDPLVGKQFVYECADPQTIPSQLSAALGKADWEHRRSRFEEFVAYLLTDNLICHPSLDPAFRSTEDAAEMIMGLVDQSAVRPAPDQVAAAEPVASSWQDAALRSDGANVIYKNLIDAEVPDAELAGLFRSSDGLLPILDLDNTLLLENSTEMFLNSARPRWLAALISDIVKKFRLWRVFKKDKDAFDQVRVWLIGILMPWTWLVWRIRADSLCAPHRNHKLLDALPVHSDRAPVIVTFGYAPIVRPMLKGLGLENARLIASALSPWKQEGRELGKEQMLHRNLDEGTLRKSFFVTDSPEDLDAADSVESTFLIEWHTPRPKAFHNAYYPFRYTSLGKYAGKGVVRRHRLGEDVPVILLSYAPFLGGLLLPTWEAAALLPALWSFACLFISFNAVYEIGYFENDFDAAKREAKPNVSREARAFAGLPVRRSGWLWGLTFGALAFAPVLAYPGWLNAFVPVATSGLVSGTASSATLWAALAMIGWCVCLLITRAVFFVHNRLPEPMRLHSFMALHFLRLAVYAPFLGLSTVAIAIIPAQVFRHVANYIVYRFKGDTGGYPRLQFRLSLFVCLVLLATLVAPTFVTQYWPALLGAFVLFARGALHERYMSVGLSTLGGLKRSSRAVTRRVTRLFASPSPL